MQEFNNILVLDVSLCANVSSLCNYDHSLSHLQSSMSFAFFTSTDDELNQ